MHKHNERHQDTASRKALRLALILTASMIAAEAAGGFLANSLALIGDAGHMLVDALSLGLSLFALTIASRPATTSRTYGYHRVEIFAALINGVLLVGASAVIFYEAYQRFRNPPEVQTTLLLIIAVIGLLDNLASFFILRQASPEYLKCKSRFLACCWRYSFICGRHCRRYHHSVYRMEYTGSNTGFPHWHHYSDWGGTVGARLH